MDPQLTLTKELGVRTGSRRGRLDYTPNSATNLCDTSGGTEVSESEDQEAIPGGKEETDGALLGDTSPDITEAAGRPFGNRTKRGWRDY